MFMETKTIAATTMENSSNKILSLITLRKINLREIRMPRVMVQRRALRRGNEKIQCNRENNLWWIFL